MSILERAVGHPRGSAGPIASPNKDKGVESNRLLLRTKLPRVSYFLAGFFFAAFLGAAFLAAVFFTEAVDLTAALLLGFAVFFLVWAEPAGFFLVLVPTPKAVDQPSEYFFVEPVLTIVTVPSPKSSIIESRKTTNRSSRSTPIDAGSWRAV